MARIARITVPGAPHHVTQRGNRRQPLFVEPGDYALYRDLLAERCKANGVVCWGYCFMPNHVHLVLTPATPEGLSRAVGEAHRRYTAFFNARARVTGHLFQGRFASAAMDEEHLLNVLRYLAFNPVRAGLARLSADWPHASVAAHLSGRDDALVSVEPALQRVPRFADLLEPSLEEQRALERFDNQSANGRPMGDSAFLAAVERKLGRAVTPQKRGPKPKPNKADAIP
jgi:putative transposase